MPILPSKCPARPPAPTWLPAKERVLLFQVEDQPPESATPPASGEEAAPQPWLPPAVPSQAAWGMLGFRTVPGFAPLPLLRPWRVKRRLPPCSPGGESAFSPSPYGHFLSTCSALLASLSELSLIKNHLTYNNRFKRHQSIISCSIKN